MGQAGGQEVGPVGQKELLLTDTKQTGHQWEDLLQTERIGCVIVMHA